MRTKANRDYHSRRFQLSGCISALKSLSLSMPKEIYDRIRALDADMSLLLKTQYQDAYKKEKPL